MFAAQLDHLIATAATIPVRVVPIGDGWHPGLVGPFAVYSFTDQPSIVLAEHHRSSVFLYSEQVSAAYQDAAVDLLGRALSPAESVELIREVRRRE